MRTTLVVALRAAFVKAGAEKAAAQGRAVSVTIRACSPDDPKDLEACRDLWRELTQRHRDIHDERRQDRPQRAATWVAEENGKGDRTDGLGSWDEPAVQVIIRG